MASDLHMHTTFSDGRLTPEELMAEAKAAGLSYMAITDHDTVDGVKHLYEHGFYPTRGIRIIPGIEFSVHHPVHAIHIVAFNIDIYNARLNARLEELRAGRQLRFSKMVAKLKEIGYPLTEAEVLTAAGDAQSIGRPHIARALMARGYFTTMREVFDKVLGKGKPAYVSHARITLEEVIDLVKDVGGVTVLAHPKLVGSDDLVEEICGRGIDGIEVFYPRHDEADQARYWKLADRYQLMMSGGSDYHALPTREPKKLGEFTIEDNFAAQFYRTDVIL